MIGRVVRYGMAVVLGLGVLLDLALPPDFGRWQNSSAEVVDSNGALLRPFVVESGLWRLATTADQVDPLYLSLLKAVEDQRFDFHPGVDPLAVVRAVGQMVASGRRVSGASTLTMQAARLLRPQPRTVFAKIEESLRALQMRQRLGKDGVLGIYLTLAPFGGAVEGVRAAAWVWFGKDPSQLTPAEAALLVALPQAPERLRPDRFPAAAWRARAKVLDRAVVTGVLTAEVAATAKQSPLPTVMLPMPSHAGHLADRLVRQSASLVLQTTVDKPLQQRLEAVGQRHRALLRGDGADVAVVVVRNRDRNVLAHLGSGDWRQRPLDLTRARRSPGSALKPIIYAMAFDDLSLHPSTLIEDGPWRFGEWLPRNFDRDYSGTVTVREALQRSLNVPAVLALSVVGPARFVSHLRANGVVLSTGGSGEAGLPLALGGVGTTLEDVTTLYAGLAAGGMVQPLRFMPTDSTAAATTLVSVEAAKAVLDCLAAVMPPLGYAEASHIRDGRQIAWKTGTSYGYRDAWAVGSSTDYTIGVWVGKPDGGARAGQTGYLAAAPLLFEAFALLPHDQGAFPTVDPDHALLQRQPPLGLVRLSPPLNPADRHVRPLRVLFPPDGATVELLPQGIALKSAGGRLPHRWSVNGLPLSATETFWQPDGEGFAKMQVEDADGRISTARIRVALP